MRIFALIPAALLAACSSEIYTRDGVTDGDTFYLAPSAYENNDPAYQSWVTYSLIKSTCQLEIGGPNPARASSFDCELKARGHLVRSWEEKRTYNPAISDHYLDALSNVEYEGFLAEYTHRYFGQRAWEFPEGLRDDEFRRWQRKHLRRHRPQTRIIGSWNYRDTVVDQPY